MKPVATVNFSSAVRRSQSSVRISIWAPKPQDAKDAADAAVADALLDDGAARATASWAAMPLTDETAPTLRVQIGKGTHHLGGGALVEFLKRRGAMARDAAKAVLRARGYVVRNLL